MSSREPEIQGYAAKEESIKFRVSSTKLEPPVNRMDKHYCSDIKWPSKIGREILNNALKEVY